MLKRQGYLNDVTVDGEWVVKTPSVPFASIEVEKAVWESMGYKARIENNVLFREVIDGEVVKEWDDEIMETLYEKIELFHQQDIDLSIHDWNRFDHNIKHLAPKHVERLIYLKQKISKWYVPSHNDINKENILWDGKEIVLIDFEWANLNHPMFDYVQLDIAEGVKLAYFDTDEYKRLKELTLLYFILWTYDAPKTKYVTDLRNKYIMALSSL